MYDLWYKGKAPLGPYKDLDTKSMNSRAQKNRSMALTCINTINSFVPNHTAGTAATDDQFRAGCHAMCTEMVRRGHGCANVSLLINKVVHNAYTSLYSNHMKFIRA